MIMEVLLELVVILASVFVVSFFTASLVRLINRVTKDWRCRNWRQRNPRRCFLARRLNEEYAGKNGAASTDTATIILVSSVGCYAVIGIVVGFLVTLMLSINHLRGAAQVIIDGGVSTHIAFCLATGIISLLGWCAGVVAVTVAIESQASRARSLANERIERGHKVIFGQAKGLDERVVAAIAQLIHRIRYRRRRHINRN